MCTKGIEKVLGSPTIQIATLWLACGIVNLMPVELERFCILAAACANGADVDVDDFNPRAHAAPGPVSLISLDPGLSVPSDTASV